MKADSETLTERVRTITWFHRIDLGNGIVNEAERDTFAKIASLHVPSDLSGRMALDLGTSEGAFAFECERRGAARVLATDHFAWQNGGDAGFSLAHEVARRTDTSAKRSASRTCHLSPTAVFADHAF